MAGRDFLLDDDRAALRLSQIGDEGEHGQPDGHDGKHRSILECLRSNADRLDQSEIHHGRSTYQSEHPENLF